MKKRVCTFINNNEKYFSRRQPASALFMKFVGLPSRDYDIRYFTDIRTFIFIYFTIDRNGLSLLAKCWNDYETISFDTI